MKFDSRSLTALSGEELLNLVGDLGRRAGNLEVLGFNGEDGVAGLMEREDVDVTDVLAFRVGYTLLSELLHREMGGETELVELASDLLRKLIVDSASGLGNELDHLAGVRPRLESTREKAVGPVQPKPVEGSEAEHEV